VAFFGARGPALSPSFARSISRRFPAVKNFLASLPPAPATARIWAILLAAALLETAGDAIIRHGLRSRVPRAVAAGCLLLAVYGLLVNTVKWDFAKLLGVYVAVFATVSVLTGRIVFAERVPPAAWAGLALIVAGGALIQFGSR
jgi:small multidrug resistance family-3 protein